MEFFLNQDIRTLTLCGPEDMKSMQETLPPQNNQSHRLELSIPI